MHSPQHDVEGASLLSQNRPSSIAVVSTTTTSAQQQQQQQQQQQLQPQLQRQRYAKSRFLMRLPRRHNVVHHRTSAAAAAGGGGADNSQTQPHDDYDFVDSLLEAEEDTNFIDNLIGASSRKKQEDLDPHNHHHHHHLEMAKQPQFRRFRLVGRRVLYSLGTFILLYAFMSFRQSRNTKWAWNAYKESMHDNFAAFPEQQQRQQRQQQQRRQRRRSGSAGGANAVRQNNLLYDNNNNNNLQQGGMYDPSLSQNTHQGLQHPNAFWSTTGQDELTTVSSTSARLSPQQQLSAAQYSMDGAGANNAMNSGGQFPLAFHNNGYPNTNHGMQQQQQQVLQQQPLGYSMVGGGNPSLLLRGQSGGFASDGASSSQWQLGENINDNNMGVRRGRPQQQQRNNNNNKNNSMNKKRNKGWRILRQKQKPDDGANAAAVGADFDDGSSSSILAAAERAVKSSSSSSTSTLLLDPTATQSRVVGGGNFVMGNGMIQNQLQLQPQLRRPYTHGYD